jgi:Mitochondrial carrier protein
MPGLDDPSVINVVAGGIAGAATAVFVCPLDVLKTRMQVQSVKAGDLRYSLRGEVIAQSHCRCHCRTRTEGFGPLSMCID